MFIFYIGCCFASFLMVIAQRVPAGEDFLYSRSRCHHCQQKLAFYELLPLISAVLLRFRCRTCRQKIPLIYFGAEFIYGCLFFLITTQQVGPTKIAYLIWLTMAFLLSLTDLFYWTVEPKILYPFGFLLWMILFLCAWQLYFSTLIFLLLINLIVYFFLQDYFGFGDVLLLLFWGPWFSLHQLFILLFVASLSGLILSALLTLIRKKTIRHLPFVPFLSLGLFYLLFF